MTPTSMRAVVLDAPGPPEALQIREVPVPTPEPGQVLIEVEAFCSTHRLERVAEAHADMEAGRATGKLVVLP